MEVEQTLQSKNKKQKTTTNKQADNDRQKLQQKKLAT